MASSDAWAFRPAPSFPDSWISESDAITKALQQSLFSSDSLLLSPDFADPDGNLDAPISDPDSTTPEVPTPKPPLRRLKPAAGKVTKRKSRASAKKKSQTTTTFINADPANFREMVQQVTGGVLFADAPVVRQRLGGGGASCYTQQAAGEGGLGGGGGACLPTLDTSAFLLDRDQQAAAVSAARGGGEVVDRALPFAHAPAEGGGGGGGIDFDGFSGFPTLESWKMI